MVKSGEQDVASQLISHRELIDEQFTPNRLEEKKIGISPGLAALSLLTPRRDLWAAHCLVVGCAVETAADPDDPFAAQSRLADHSLSKWFYDDQFTAYISSHPAVPSDRHLEIILRVMEQAIDSTAMAEAQLETIKIIICIAECGKDLACLSRCLGS